MIFGKRFRENAIFLFGVMFFAASGNGYLHADNDANGEEKMLSSYENNIPKSLRKEFHEAAIRTADWMVENQVRNWGDANNGRFLSDYNPETGSANYSNDWMTASSIMGLLMTWRRTGEKKYLDAACRAGGYLKTLQILDERNEKYFGAIREDTPQTTWCYPRDALTAAWAMLWLYDETGDEEYLYRVNLFIDWFKNEVMVDGWPLWEVNYRGEPYKNIHLEGSFHGGDGAFFYDYYRITGDKSHLDDGLKFIADHLLERFLQEDGSYRIIWHKEKKKYLDGEDSPRYPLGWQIMHRYNDDFSGITLMDAWIYFGDRKYLEGMEKFAAWLMKNQQEDGSFHPDYVASASATVPIELIDLYRLTENEKYLRSAIRAGKHLLTLQETELTDKKAFGGFYGMSNNDLGKRERIILRTSSYALIALLKLEGKKKGPYFSAGEKK